MLIKKMNKKLITLFLFFFVFKHLQSQKIYFKSSKNTLETYKNIELLAKNIEKKLPKKNRKTYLGNLFRIQIASKKHVKSLQNLDSLRVIFKKGGYGDFSHVAGIQYELYTKTKEESINSNIPINYKLISESLDKIYAKIIKKGIIEDSFFYFDDTKDLKLKSLNESLSIKNDSITLKRAIKICRNYASFLVASTVNSHARIYSKKILDQKYIIKDSLIIKTRDKGELSAIIVRKRKQEKPLPVVLKFSIYPSSYDIGDAKIATTYGYHGANVFVRGKKNSENELYPFELDANDLYDAIDWISKQPWCNGSIVMYGGSYLGFAQWAGAKKLHPALKAIAPMVSVGPGIDYPMYNNVFMSYMLRWIRYVNNNKMTDEKDFSNTEKWKSLYKKWYKGGYAFNKLDSLLGKENKLFQRWLKHPSYDSYWTNMKPHQNDFSKINIPILTFTGYYDSDQAGALSYHKEHLKYNPKANHTLLIGPYDHSGGQGFPKKILGGYKIDSVANIRQIPLTFKWFNYLLKDSIKPKLLKDKVNYQVMGTGKWKHVSSTSKMNNDTLKFYLKSKHQKENYTLSLKKSTKSHFVKQIVDFKDRSMNRPFSKKKEKILDSILDTKEKLRYITKKLDFDFEINGSFLGKINLEINKRDLDVVLELFQVTPEGKYFSLSTYLGRASYAKNNSRRNLLSPNKKEIIPIKNASFVSKFISKGSRLLLVVSVNKNPDWQINYGTGKDVSTETIKDAKYPLEVKWYTDSFIKIPVFKY